jgi:uncharacterized membrane protein
MGFLIYPHTSGSQSGWPACSATEIDQWRPFLSSQKEMNFLYETLFILLALAKTGHGPHSSKLVFVLSYSFCFMGILYYSMYYFILFYVLFYILCIVCVYMCTNHCHRVFTQLQLTNISISRSIHLTLFCQSGISLSTPSTWDHYMT